MFTRTFALLLALAAAAPGCTSSLLYKSEDSTPQWVEYDLENGPPSRDLYRICQTAMVRAGFPPGTADEGVGRLQSGWEINLAPYAYQGYREKAIIEVLPQAERYHYQLRVRVRKDDNLEPANTLDINHAEWEPAADDQNRAKVVLQHVLAQIRPVRGG